MRTFALLILLSASTPDIAPFHIPRKGEALATRKIGTAVAMTAEVVELTLNRDHAHVVAKFWLANTSDAAEKLLLGFPSAAMPSHLEFSNNGVDVREWGKQAIRAFEASVDGEAVPADALRKEESRSGWADHENWLFWEMSVEPGAERVVEVAYDVMTGDPNYIPPSRLQNRQLTYVLKTGRGWHGSIGDVRVVARAGEGVTLEHVEVAAPKPERRDEREIVWHWTNFEPDTDVLVQYHAYRDAEDAVAKTRARLASEEPMRWFEEMEVALDLAENLEALERWREAGDAFTFLADREVDHKSMPYRRPQIEYVPPIYRAAHCYRKAGDSVAAARAAKRAVGWMRRLLADLEARRSAWIRKSIGRRRGALRGYIAELEKW